MNKTIQRTFAYCKRVFIVPKLLTLMSNEFDVNESITKDRRKRTYYKRVRVYLGKS